MKDIRRSTARSCVWSLGLLILLFIRDEFLYEVVAGWARPGCSPWGPNDMRSAGYFWNHVPVRDRWSPGGPAWQATNPSSTVQRRSDGTSRSYTPRPLHSRVHQRMRKLGQDAHQRALQERVSARDGILIGSLVSSSPHATARDSQRPRSLEWPQARPQNSWPGMRPLRVIAAWPPPQDRGTSRQRSGLA